MGRPTKLTEEAQAVYLRAVAVGVYPEVAARHAGFSPASLYRYLRGSTPRQVEFRQEHDKAVASLEIRLTATLSQAALTQPRVALVLLERRFPERWARTRADDPADPSRATRPTPERPVVLDPALLGELIPRLLEAGRQLNGRTIEGTAVDVTTFEDRGLPTGAAGESE